MNIENLHMLIGLPAAQPYQPKFRKAGFVRSGQSLKQPHMMPRQRAKLRNEARSLKVKPKAFAIYTATENPRLVNVHVPVHQATFVPRHVQIDAAEAAARALGAATKRLLSGKAAR